MNLYLDNRKVRELNEKHMDSASIPVLAFVFYLIVRLGSGFYLFIIPGFMPLRVFQLETYGHGPAH